MEHRGLMPDGPLCDNLEKLLQSMERPAVLLQMPQQLILFSNAAAMREYGLRVRDGAEVHLPISADADTHSFVVDNQRDDKLYCHAVTAANARLSLMLFPQEMAVLVETVASGPRRNNAEPTPTPSYHVSYIQDLVSGRRHFSDPSVLAQLGLPEVDARHSEQQWRQMILPEDRSLFDNTMAAARRHGGNHALRYRMRGAVGQVVEICDFCGVTKGDGESWPMLVGSVLSGDDGYRRIKQAERQALVGQLAGGMVHDFKNLLGGMQNMIEWCISQSAAGSEVAEALNRIVSYTDQAAGLVHGVLAVIGGKQEEDKVEEIDLGQLLNSMAVLLRHVVSASINLTIEVDAAAPTMYGTRGLLQNLILNLCINARDAMKGQGDLLQLEVYRLERLDEHGDSQACVGLRIRDNGCGMSEEKLVSVFDAFYSTKAEGAGLGLWMVREATRAFDGRIEVSSSVGVGTCFEIVFPAADGSRPAAAAKVKVAPRREMAVAAAITTAARPAVLGSWDGQNRKLLFVEDDPLLRSGVFNWLKAMNFNVICAEDGSQGLALFNEHASQLDLIIQDMILPGIRGDELLRHFKQNQPELPVIVSSALPDDESLQWMRQERNVHFLPKPFRIETLIDLCREIFATTTV